MKKIIIISHNLRIGGVERSLIGLLNAIDYNQYDVDLFLFLHDGELMHLIPKEVNLLPQNKKYAGLISPIKENLKNGNFNILLGKYKAKKQAQKFIQENKLGAQNMVYDNYMQKYTLPYLPQINKKEYDLAISFLTPHYVAAHKIKAKTKIAWIHTDYSFFEFDRTAEVEMWYAFNYIASISDSVTQGFVETFPVLKPKIRLIENILHEDFIHQQADAFSVEKEMPSTQDEWKLLSVGRFSHQKNFDNVPVITKKLNELGLNIKWYLIGYGSDENLIRQKIKETEMNGKVIILGKKDNPYPYMKACDIYVQPSRYEGKAVTVREAQILAKPVIITDFPTSQSQLTDGFDGIIVPLDNPACGQGIAEFILNAKLQNQLIENCRNSNFGNAEEVQKIYNLIQSKAKKTAKT